MRDPGKPAAGLRLSRDALRLEKPDDAREGVGF
jgi:hypothetical protein